MTGVEVRTSGRPTGPKLEAIEEALMSAAFDEFAEHGYASASLTRIVARARMSKTTLYSRYPSKEALFKEVMRQQIESQKPYEILQSCVAPLDVEQDLERFAIEILNFSFGRRMCALNRVIVGEAHRFPALAQAGEEKLQRGITRITDYLKTHPQNDGDHIVDPEGIAEAFIHMMRGWYLHRLFGSAPTTDEDVRVWVRKAVRALTRPAPSW